jgi:hypothetical protein
MTENQTQSPSPVDEINKTPVVAEWLETLELGYEGAASSNITRENTNSSVCFSCGISNAKLSKCAKCNVASYCSKECQLTDWKPVSKGGGGHKMSCPAYARLELGDNADVYQLQLKTEKDKTDVRNEIFGRIRIYACSYAVHRTSSLGRGFLFLQSNNTLAMLSTPFPKDGYGIKLVDTRAVLMHFLTIGEYDREVCRDDFEMASVRSKLQAAVEEYDEQKEMVLLMRFRCGHVALGKAKLVPDHGVCKVLGLQYYAETSESAVQLNLDDV